MPTTVDKPTILIVPGSFSSASFYDSLVTALLALSYPTIALSLPSTTRLPSAATMADDAAHIHSAVAKLADEGRNVVILTHSYGGIPGTEAVRGLVKTDREAEGKSGGVVRMVYLSSIVPPVGGSQRSVVGELPEIIKVEVRLPCPHIYPSCCHSGNDQYHNLGLS